MPSKIPAAFRTSPARSFSQVFKVADNCGPAVTEYLNSLWNKQLTKREIAACAGLREATLQERIKYHRRINGLFAPRPCDNPAGEMSDKDWAQWRRWWRKGLTYSEIAAEAGVTERAVNRRIEKARVRNPGWFPKRA